MTDMFLYVASLGDGLIKIGMSCNPYGRVSCLRYGKCPGAILDMAIRCDESDISAAEKSAHGILSEFSYRGFNESVNNPSHYGIEVFRCDKGAAIDAVIRAAAGERAERTYMPEAAYERKERRVSIDKLHIGDRFYLNKWDMKGLYVLKKIKKSRYSAKCLGGYTDINLSSKTSVIKADLHDH